MTKPMESTEGALIFERQTNLARIDHCYLIRSLFFLIVLPST